MNSNFKINPKLDLVIERILPITPEQVWKAWTIPQNLMQWFCPRPWKTIECEMDLKPGGVFRTIMQSPEGENFPNVGCFLELELNKRLTWTSCMLEGFRPVPAAENGADLLFTAKILIEPHAQGCQYTAIAIHRNEADAQRHAQMGFHEGWGITIDQMVYLYSS
jgi:uncharacterized protein YndB with AHSA1/START domain